MKKLLHAVYHPAKARLAKCLLHYKGKGRLLSLTSHGHSSHLQIDSYFMITNLFFNEGVLRFLLLFKTHLARNVKIIFFLNNLWQKIPFAWCKELSHLTFARRWKIWSSNGDGFLQAYCLETIPIGIIIILLLFLTINNNSDNWIYLFWGKWV